jgi:bifunctional DNase/RNase
LFFVFLQITFAREQNGDRSAGARGFADKRRVCSVPRNNDKVFIIYVDQTVGSAITMFMRQITKERPLTHDLLAHLLTALGAKVERVIINDLKNATYYARVIIRVQNELHQKKIIELDGRPSDCIAMATQQKAPIYVSQDVWDEVDDMSDVLRKMEEEGLKPDPEAEE